MRDTFHHGTRREGQQNAERNASGDSHSSYYGGYYAPAAAGGGGYAASNNASAGGGGYATNYAGGGGYAASYGGGRGGGGGYDAWAAASGQLPYSMQGMYYRPHSSSPQGFAPQAGARSSTIDPHSRLDDRRVDSYDEDDEDEDAEFRWRARKAGPRDMPSIYRGQSLIKGEEPRRLSSGMFSEVASMSTELPFMDTESVVSKAERAARAAYEKLLAEKRGVTVWKVVQAALLTLNSESLESLGISLHEVPSLRKLLILEGKINTYIHCYVAVRRITTVHDLSREISQNEGVKNFDNLKLGPISFHPLVAQYFAFPGGFEVCQISTEDVLNHMSDFMNKNPGKIQVDDFLTFMTNARSLPSPQHLGVRIRSFGMYISFIRREKKLEKAIQSHRASLASGKETALQQEVQGSSITKRIDAFLASAAEEYTQHVSLSSDGEDNTKVTPNVKADRKKGTLGSSQPQLNSCPYPSAAEERDRICTKLPADVNEELLKSEYALSKQELGDFVAAWRGFCHGNSVSDVLMQMLFANGTESKKSLKKKRKLARLFKVYPAIGLLNVAILSMKAGHWNSMYDAFEEAVSTDVYASKGANAVEAVDRIEVVSSEPCPAISKVLNSKDSSTDIVCPSVEVLDETLAMLGNICEDISNSSGVCAVGFSEEEEFGLILKRIIKCEQILLEQLLPKKALNSKFKDSSGFVELYLDRISKIISGIRVKKVENNLDIILPEGRVKTFICQVASALENTDGLSENIISQLLAKQFRLINASEWCLHAVKKHPKALKSEKVSSFLLFYSCALLADKTGRLPIGEIAVDFDNKSIETKNVPRVGSLGSLTSMDARNCLLKAPMLCNLLEWSQWDAVFSPTLGPLLDWLEREGSAGELVCLVTCEGSILRIDGTATVDSFLAAAVKGLGKEAALQLVSLLAAYGGVDRVPRALLRSYSSKAIEILVGRSIMDDRKRRKPLSALETGQLTKRAKHSLPGDAGSLSRLRHPSVDNISEDMSGDKFSGALEFVLELLSWVPSEFVVFVASTVILALCDIVPSAPAAMLNSCSTVEYRMRLYEVGLALGIPEWVNDFHSLFLEPRCSITERASEVPPSSNVLTEASLTNSPGTVASDEVSNKALKDKTFIDYDDSVPSTVGESGQQRDLSALKFNSFKVDSNDCDWSQSKLEDEANEVIASIRKEEFGMDVELTSKELKLLTKQHARIGRALQCLSRELYSQDSHYVLELVQNADDNQYAPDVDAMLVFILQHERVVVVNNELGFTPANMKALCDVGSSTKIGSAGYIGQKGIGFKSVFRITDSPQIHSKGFHVKFDVSEGSIGFVLPTVIPPVNDWCTIEEVLSTTENLTKHGKQKWNTCMVLPLKDSVVNGPDVELLSSKLGDIQPSLLLFLRQLCSITVKDYLRGSIRIMQRYDLDNGFVRVSDNESTSHWLVVKQQLDTAVVRPGVETTEIALAFPLQEVSTGEFEACNEHQQVFAFLPLRSYGLRFIVQGDFVLPSSREDLDRDNSWNQWLLSEIPNVCVKALEAFKGVSCFKQDAGRAASIFMSFLPFEGEVQGFFSSLPRMIYASLRASPCLPIEGRKGDWALPCVLLGGWNDSVKNLLPEQLLWELLGLRYLHKDVALSPVLASELGVRSYGLQVLIDFMEGLCASKDVLARLGPRWISSWLVALHRCLSRESQEYLYFSRSKAAIQELKRIRSLPFIPLSNGTYTSLEDGPVWLPSVDATSATETTGLSEYFPLLYSELRTVHVLLLMPDCKDNKDTDPESVENDMLARPEERNHLFLMLRQLGVGQILEHEVVTKHILPSMISGDIWTKSKSLLMQCLAFVMVHLQSDCKDCKMNGQNILKDLQNSAIVVTNKGYKRVSEERLHFGVEFGCPIDVKKILKGLQIPWTEVDPAYLQAFQGWPGDVSCSKWRSFFKELGVTDFVKLELVQRKLHDKATSIWKDISWEGYDRHGNAVTVRDWESPEAVQILENLCNLSFDLPDRLLQCSQMLSSFDLLWEESYSQCKATYWSDSSLEPMSEHDTLPSFILSLRSFAWVQSSFDGKLYHPRELFYQCSTVESILGNNAPYATPQIKSSKLAIALGLQTVVSAPVVRHVLKLWNQLPIHLSVGQMTKLYTWLWDEMNGDKDMQQFLQNEAWIFVPGTTVVKTSVPILGRFLPSKDVIWREKTGCLSLLLSADDASRERLSFRALNTLYPTLRPFFVDECHVQDTLNFQEYYRMLKILADIHSPRKVLDLVLAVFAMWSNNIKTGQVSSTELCEWKELLIKSESQVLPTVQDKWVSLHGSEGIVCWCDDKALGQMFLGSKGIYYVCVSTAASNTESINVEKLGSFLQAMNIPPLSKVVEREPIAYGAQRSKHLMELLNWAVPYVQRYLQKWHPEAYNSLQKSGIDSRLSRFTCVVCDQLFFRYKLPGDVGSASERLECSCLLEGDVLYATQLDSLNNIFLEFSKLFFDRMSDLQLANFLHLITLSVQSGSNETEVEALLASQGINSFPEGEAKWTFQFSDNATFPESVLASKEFTEPLVTDSAARKVKRSFADTWPPRSLQQTVSNVKHRSAHADRLAACQRSLDTVMNEIEAKKKRKILHSESSAASDMPTAGAVHQDDGDGAYSIREETSALLLQRDDLSSQISFPVREQLSVGQPNEQHQELTGRLGEAVVFNHLLEKHGPEHVKWINAESESGYPYDIVLEGVDGEKKLVEVKTTWSEGKDWFEISQHEWELACKMGDRFVITRVFLGGGSSARFLWLPDPSRLCQQRLIKLALILPPHQHGPGLLQHL